MSSTTTTTTTTFHSKMMGKVSSLLCSSPSSSTATTSTHHHHHHPSQSRIDNISNNDDDYPYHYSPYLQDCCLDTNGNDLPTTTPPPLTMSLSSCATTATATATAATTTTTTTTATTCSCPTTLPLWVRSVRWMIRIVLKPYAPLLYMGVALGLGILLGILLQRYWDSYKLQRRQQQRQQQQTWKQRTFVQNILLYYYYYYFTPPSSSSSSEIETDTATPSSSSSSSSSSPTTITTTCNGKAYTTTTTTTPTTPSTIVSSSPSSSTTTTLQDKEEQARRRPQPPHFFQQQNRSSSSSPPPTKEEEEEEPSSPPCGGRRESTIPLSQIPKHIAVIMDGNRRYGTQTYGVASQGHSDGCHVLCEFAKWCCAEHIPLLTVYAFSTENWNRSPSEIDTLMTLFATYCEELRIQAIQQNIRVCVLSTETDRIPPHVMEGLQRMEQETQHCQGGLTMNICVSYGSRGEIIHACRSMAQEVVDGHYEVSQIDEHRFESKLLTCPPRPHPTTTTTTPTATPLMTPREFQHSCHNPDIVIRTSGEYRLSNFLLWQLAYSEMFFLSKPWPAMQKQDLLQVLETYAQGRSRRFGK